MARTEDREDDIILVKEGFARADIRNPLHVVRDGDEALAYLLGEGEFANRDRFPFPDLLLLDLQMPRRDGFELLQTIKSHPELKLLRTIVLTSSCEISDINKAYRLGANSFMVKPNDFQDYAALSHTMAKFWFERSEKPEVPILKAEDA